MIEMILVDYIDVWTNGEGGFDVNNLTRYDEKPVEVNDPDDEMDVLISLVEYGYLLPEAVNDEQVEVDYSAADFCIEINIKESGEPVCRLEYIEEV